MRTCSVPIYCMRAAIPLMKARGGGGIVNVTSESVNRPYPFLTVYAATKSAMETLSAGLRTELRGQRDPDHRAAFGPDERKRIQSGLA